MAEGDSCLNRLYKVFSSPIILLIFLIAYSFGGAALFQYVESPHETQEKYNIIEMREDIVDNVLNSTYYGQRVGVKKQKFEAEMREELKRYEAQLYAAFAHGINTDSEEEVWDLWGALIFCTTVYTTVGYGHIAPATDTGRILTMVYGLVGIPLCLIVLAELGKFFTIVLKFLWSFVRRFFHTGQCKKVKKTVRIKAVSEVFDQVESKLGIDRSDAGASTSQAEVIEEVEEEVQFEVDDEFNLPPLVAIIITILYILGGALMYMQWEDWDYLEAFYFIFISISTVGFGDVLPSHKAYFLISFMYQMFGLALVAMVINVVMEVVQSTLDKVVYVTTSLGQKIGIPVGDIVETKLKKNE